MFTLTPHIVLTGPITLTTAVNTALIILCVRFTTLTELYYFYAGKENKFEVNYRGRVAMVAVQLFF